MPAPSPFENQPPRPIAIEVFGRSAILVFPGDLDQREDDLGEVVAHAIRCGHHRLVLDFTATTCLGGDSYRAILHALKALGPIEQAAVVVARAEEAVEQMLHLLEVDLIFTAFRTRGDALRALRDPSRSLNADWRTASPPPLVPPGAARATVREPSPARRPVRAPGDRVPLA